MVLWTCQVGFDLAYPIHQENIQCVIQPSLPQYAPFRAFSASPPPIHAQSLEISVGGAVGNPIEISGKIPDRAFTRIEEHEWGWEWGWQDFDVEYTAEFEPEIGHAVAFTFMTASTKRTRLEIDASYAKMIHTGVMEYHATQWSERRIADVETNADIISIGSNVISTLPRNLTDRVSVEVGLGAGVYHVSEFCITLDRKRTCPDETDSGWKLQGIIGLVGPMQDTTEWSIRYRLQQLGTLDSEDRMHMLTFGVRFPI